MKLADRVAIRRRDSRVLVPVIRELSNFKKITDMLADPGKARLLAELATLLRKLGF